MQQITITNSNCIIFIGMDELTKNYVSMLLSQRIEWPYITTQQLIEATYGLPINTLIPLLTQSTFFEVQHMLIFSISVRRTIISVADYPNYTKDTMQYLKNLGPLIYINFPNNYLSSYSEDFCNKQDKLYSQWATVILSRKLPSEQIVNTILKIFKIPNNTVGYNSLDSYIKHS